MLIYATFLVLADYCTTLEGDDCHSCWRAYFELKDLEVCVLGTEWPIIKVLYDVIALRSLFSFA